MSDASEVRVGRTGAVYYAPAGTPLPTSATAVLDEDFEELGFLTPDGINEQRSETSVDIEVWQMGQTVRTIATSDKTKWGFAAAQTNPTVLRLYYGHYDAAGTKIGGNPQPKGVFVIDVIDDDNLERTVIPDGVITDRSNRTIKTTEGIAYPMAITPQSVAAAPFEGAGAIQYRAIAA